MNRAGYAMLAVALSAMPAHADVTKQDCVDANMKGQSLQRDGKLRAAKEALLVCASASYPATVRDDCTQQLDALNRKLPSILFEGHRTRLGPQQPARQVRVVSAWSKREHAIGSPDRLLAGWHFGLVLGEWL
jgi:hypothetical protein